MTRDRKSCLKAIIVWILVAILFIVIQKTDQTKGTAPEVSEQNLIPVDNRADKIDQFFKIRKMPLAGTGQKFVAEADEHGLDWRLLAAISVQESTGGKRMPAGTHNAFGWNSGQYKFKSFDEAIEYISDKFDNGKYYRGKDTVGILKTYNPPSVNKNYPGEVLGIMINIGEQESKVGSPAN